MKQVWKTQHQFEMTTETKKFDPTNKLSSKIKYDGPFAVTDDVLEKAEQQLQKLSDDYLKHAAEDIKKLQKLFSELKSNRNDFNRHLEEIFAVAHNVKGNGGTFGYDLITNIAYQLCRLIEDISIVPDDFTLQAVELHISSLATAHSNNLRGDGGATGKSLLSGLDAVNGKWRELHKNA